MENKGGNFKNCVEIFLIIFFSTFSCSFLGLFQFIGGLMFRSNKVPILCLFEKLFIFPQILNRTNNIFELVTSKAVQERPGNQRKTEQIALAENDDDDVERKLRLKGQMIYMDNWRMIMFLGTPVMPKLTSLISTGLYINDLSMHDFSR
jgi:hypothetical protein